MMRRLIVLAMTAGLLGAAGAAEAVPTVSLTPSASGSEFIQSTGWWRDASG